MKIIHIIYSGLGGQGSVLFPIIESLKKEKLFKSIIFFYGKEELLKNYIDQCKKLNLNFSYFNSNYRFSNFKIFLKLIKLKPNKIILHTSCIIPLLFYKLIQKVTLVKILHTDIKLYAKNDWIILFFSIIFFNKIVVLTNDYKEKIIKYLPFFFRRKFLVISPGIFFDKKNKQKKIEKKKNYKIGMAGRFDNGKRFDLLIDMMALIKKNKSNLRIRLSLVGDGPNLLKLKNHQNYKENKNFITFEGTISKSKLKKWYKSLDIYLHATQYEVVNTAILEAMSFRLPIIASDIPSIRYQIHYGYRCGLICQNNPNSFKEKLIMLLNKNLIYRELSRNCSKQILKKYNFKKNIQKYKDEIFMK